MTLIPPGPGGDQVLGVGAASQLAGDRLADPVTHGHHAHAGQALGFGLEAAAEPTGLIAHLDHLDPLELGEDPSAAQAQQLAAAQPGADLDEEVVAVEGPAGGQEMPELLGGEGSSSLVAEDLLGVQARWGLDLADGWWRQASSGPSGCAQDERQGLTPLWLVPAAPAVADLGSGKGDG